VLAAVRRYGSVYQAGTQQRSEYAARFRMAAEFVQSGRIGKLKEIYGYRDGGGIHWPTRFGPEKKVPAGLDWDLYLGPVPWFPYDGGTGAHRFDIGELNWGQHHYDFIQWAAGADQTGPVEIWAEDGRSSYKYGNGVVVHGNPYPGESVGGVGGAVFIGTDGRIAIDRDALISYPSEIVREPLHPNEVHLYRSDSHSGNFLQCVRTRQQTISNASVAHHSATALLLGGVAKQVNRTIKWDPEKERFLDDEPASRFLSIAKREPWQVC
jgi:hypothetical protein